MSLLDGNRWDEALRPLRQRLEEHDYQQKGSQNLVHVATTITAACEAIGITAPVVVGGLAVELYTDGGYTTKDLDLITELGPVVYEIMLALGFTYEARYGYFSHPRLVENIEFPDPPLEGSTERVLRMVFPDGSYVYVLSLEDTILIRLQEFVHWDRCRASSASAAQLTSLFRLHYDELDYDYLKDEARKRRVEEGLRYFLGLLDMKL